MVSLFLHNMYLNDLLQRSTQWSWYIVIPAIMPLSMVIYIAIIVTVFSQIPSASIPGIREILMDTLLLVGDPSALYSTYRHAASPL